MCRISIAAGGTWGKNFRAERIRRRSMRRHINQIHLGDVHSFFRVKNSVAFVVLPYESQPLLINEIEKNEGSYL